MSATLPYCPELQEPNGERQMVASVLSTAGVGLGDAVEYIVKEYVDRAVREEDGRIITVDRPARAAPIQVIWIRMTGVTTFQKSYRFYRQATKPGCLRVEYMKSKLLFPVL